MDYRTITFLSPIFSCINNGCTKKNFAKKSTVIKVFLCVYMDVLIENLGNINLVRKFSDTCQRVAVCKDNQ